MSHPLQLSKRHPATAGRSKTGIGTWDTHLPAGVSLLDGLRKRQGGQDLSPRGPVICCAVTAPARATSSEPMNAARASRAIGPGRPLPHSSHETACGHCPNVDEKPSWEEDPWRHHLKLSRCRGLPVATIRHCWICLATQTSCLRPMTLGLSVPNGSSGNSRKPVSVSPRPGSGPSLLRLGATSGTFLLIKQRA